MKPSLVLATVLTVLLAGSGVARRDAGSRGGETVIDEGFEDRSSSARPPKRDRLDVRSLRLAGPFPAVVTDVIDGDTFEARVTIWLGHEVTTRVRLLGIDAAEMGSDCSEERALAEVSRDALLRFLGSRVLLSDVRFDKYGGRVLARAHAPGEGDVSEKMLAGGYAIAYEGGRREAWCGIRITSRR